MTCGILYLFLKVWPNSEITIQVCPICGLKRPLILQLYAPLENSQFYRTLYIFSCVNAACSNQSKGWLCIRVQQLEKVTGSDKDGASNRSRTTQNINWCSGVDDWGESDGDIFSNSGDAENCNEQNGNVINKVDNR